ncbi:TPA: lytic transglycosylase domain-containing protein [Escherichia coli]|uniref:lytic transglycosylase domain-containing protein n=1 Tax=Escherichia coli TaxID=562 RepID=UPI001DE07A20|nr:lytic transglycosylase domain-containing protein [Escherichia coli]
MLKKKLLTIAISLLLCPLFACGQSKDCISEAAECFQINPLLIRAIIWLESKNQQQVSNVNKNKTVDIGVMQINTVHLPALKDRGINEELLRKNSCANVFSGAWVLKQNIERDGYTWESIGSYHSRTPIYQYRYANDIIFLITHKTSVINKVEVKMQDGIRERFPCH